MCDIGSGDNRGGKGGGGWGLSLWAAMEFGRNMRQIIKNGEQSTRVVGEKLTQGDYG